jgi:integrase
MALGVKVHVRRVEHPRYRWLATFREGGKVRKKYFTTKLDAEGWASGRSEEALNFGTALRLSDEERSAAVEFRGELAGLGKSLRQALQHAVGHFRQLENSAPVSTLIEEYQREKSQAGASLRYTQDMRSRFGRFESAFGDRIVASITPVEIEEWLRQLGLSAVSQNNFRRLLVGLFNSGKRRRYCESNPAEEVSPAKTVKEPVGILTPSQARALLKKAALELRPVIALGLFAGIRMEELERLEWRTVDLDTGYVTIPATQAKSAKRRLIPIRENLRAWIEASPSRTGSVWPSKGRDLLRQAKKDAGFGISSSPAKKGNRPEARSAPWPKNALRHSFASYHLAKFRNAGELALEMGHADTKMIFEHYRELVLANEAEDYWQIDPTNLSEQP